MSTNITFYRHFAPDILAGKKTITLRDEKESGFRPGQRLRAGYQDDGEYFATLEVVSVTPVRQSELTTEHARQENMTEQQLRQVIGQIYPGVEQLYTIHFRVC